MPRPSAPKGAAHAPHQACHHVRRVAPPRGACWPYRAGRVRHACPEGSRTRDPYTDTATAVACRRSPLAHRLRLRRGEACLAQGNTPHPRLAPLGTPSPASRGREGRGVREAPPPAARVGGHDGSVASCPGPDGPGGSRTRDPAGRARPTPTSDRPNRVGARRASPVGHPSPPSRSRGIRVHVPGLRARPGQARLTPTGGTGTLQQP